MRGIERLPGFGLVVPARLHPRAGLMTRCAVCPEAKLVRVILAAVPVTIKTGGRGSTQHSVDVTRRALGPARCCPSRGKFAGLMERP